MFTKQSSVDMDIEFDIKLLATGFLDGTVIPLNNKLKSIKLDELPIKMNKITIRKLIYGGARYTVCDLDDKDRRMKLVFLVSNFLLVYAWQMKRNV